MTSDRRGTTGPIFSLIDAVLSEADAYRDFRAGDLDQAGLNHLVDLYAERLVERSLPESDVPFVKRMPACGVTRVRESLTRLVARGLISHARFDEALAPLALRRLAQYQHGPYRTYIYPEEGLLLLALVEICRPRNVLFLGSFYGYWASWAIPSLVASGGRATLVDPDASVCAVAARNLNQGGFGHSVNVVATRGERFLAATTETFDWVVLDAENARDHPEPDQRGKRVYGPLLEAALSHLAPDAMLICHNILFSDGTGDATFGDIIARNRDELGPFMALVEANFHFVEIATTEGVGVGRRIAASGALQTPSAIGGQVR